MRREAPGDAAALRLRLMCGHVCAMAWKLGAPPDERSLCVVLFLILRKSNKRPMSAVSAAKATIPRGPER